MATKREIIAVLKKDELKIKTALSARFQGKIDELKEKIEKASQKTKEIIVAAIDRAIKPFGAEVNPEGTLSFCDGSSRYGDIVVNRKSREQIVFEKALAIVEQSKAKAMKSIEDKAGEIERTIMLSKVDVNLIELVESLKELKLEKL